MKRALCFLLLVATANLGEGASTPSPVSFSRVPVRGELVTYFDLASWAPGEELVIISHPREGKLVPLRRDGQLLPPLEPFPRDAANPAAAFAMGKDVQGPYVVYCDAWMRMARELRFDEQGHIVANVTLEGRFAPAQAKLVCLQGTPAHFAGEVFSVAVVRESETKVRQGLVRYPATPGARIAFLREHQGDSVERAMAWDFPLLAASSQGVFLLDFTTDPPSVLQLAPTTRRLANFPPGFSRPPELPPGLSGPDASTAFREGLEATPVPVGLFALDNKLLLLTRSPKPKGEALWQLHRLDPEADRLEDVLDLPTTAPKVLVVPGKVRWAILELGPAGPPFDVRKLQGLLEVGAKTLAGPWPEASKAGERPQRSSKNQ